MIDYWYEWETMAIAFNDEDWFTFGAYWGKMVADLLAKNPTMINWNYKNSESITYRLDITEEENEEYFEGDLTSSY
jgi:hypothetical protein